MKKIALITGITGQDGSFLSELLLSKGYEVHGLVRRSSTSSNISRIEHLINEITLHNGDLTDSSRLNQIIRETNPDEIYNLGAQSHVQISFEKPDYTLQANGVGVLRLLEATRAQIESSGKQIRLYQAGTSELFGKSKPPQNENSPFYPRSPYACAKLYAHWQVINYRESYGMFASNGILFNHESERRGEEFVTRKITKAATRIKLGLQNDLKIGNLDSKRDWGFAGDYVEAMWMILQDTQPQDYVVSTGQSITVREFCQLAFSSLDLDYQDYVKVDPKFFRPAEVDYLLGDPTKIKNNLGWKPTTSLEELIKRMIEHDLKIAEAELKREKTASI